MGRRLSGSEGCFGCEDIFLEEALVDELFHVFLEAPAMNGVVPLTVIVGAILFCSEKCRAILDGSWMPDLGLVLDGVEDFIDGEIEQGGLLYRLGGSVRT